MLFSFNDKQVQYLERAVDLAIDYYSRKAEAEEDDNNPEKQAYWQQDVYYYEQLLEELRNR